jgi:chitin synthase
MGIIDTTNSGALITGNLNNKPNDFRKRSFPLSSRTLRAAIEHLPFVDARRMKIEKYVFLSIMLPLK